MVTWGQPLRVQVAAEEAEAVGRMATSRKRYLGAARRVGRAGSQGSRPGSTSAMGQSRQRAVVAAAESGRWGVGACGGVGLG